MATGWIIIGWFLMVMAGVREEILLLTLALSLIAAALFA